MYIPSSFVVDDINRLHDFVQQNSFGTLISTTAAAPLATHLPLLLDRNAGPRGTLVGHMAKANPQWESASGQQVLVVFHGPHAYVSPTWYGDTNVVPTWNYVAVHATGRYVAVEDRDQLTNIVHDYVRTYEAEMPEPWSMQTADPEFVDRLTDGIVGFHIEISEIEGKWKLNQNHSIQRRQKVVAGLRQRGTANDLAVAALMQEITD